MVALEKVCLDDQSHLVGLGVGVFGGLSVTLSLTDRTVLYYLMDKSSKDVDFKIFLTLSDSGSFNLTFSKNLIIWFGIG